MLISPSYNVTGLGYVAGKEFSLTSFPKSKVDSLQTG